MKLNYLSIDFPRTAVILCLQLYLIREWLFIILLTKREVTTLVWPAKLGYTIFCQEDQMKWWCIICRTIRNDIRFASHFLLIQPYGTRRQKDGFNFGIGTDCSINQQTITTYCADRMSAPQFLTFCRGIISKSSYYLSRWNGLLGKKNCFYILFRTISRGLLPRGGPTMPFSSIKSSRRAARP